MTLVHSLQTTLAAEHAAVYVYGVLGGQASRSATPALAAALGEAYAAHRSRRDQLVAELTGREVEPVASAPAYELPARLRTRQQVEAAALDLERRCATTYAALVASSRTVWRRWAVGALTDSAVRELAFGGAAETLPGIDA
jgi:hypothetical protein